MTNIIELNDFKQERIIQRLYNNGFVPNTFITFNPTLWNRTSSFEMNLMYHFKECLGKYYAQKNVLGKRYYKYLERQYKMIVFLEHGRNRDIESISHLHLLIQILTDKVRSFYDFMYRHLKVYYYGLNGQGSDDKALIDITGEPFDMVRLWHYGDKELIKSEKDRRFRPSQIFTTKDFQKPIRHFNQYNREECIREWFTSAPIFNVHSQQSL